MTPKFDLSILPPKPNLEFEKLIWQTGVRYIAGIDEAGRGPLAGPVAAAAVILPDIFELETVLSGVHDSKQMTPVQREYWAERLKQTALSFGIGFASVQEIDSNGISQAISQAVERALACLQIQPDHLLLDYIKLPGWAKAQTSLVKGDARCLSIASASILAKTARDHLLFDLDAQYPGYGFASHKGYGTPEHLSALQKLGPCPIHRRSFHPLRPD